MITLGCDFPSIVEKLERLLKHYLAPRSRNKTATST